MSWQVLGEASVIVAIIGSITGIIGYLIGECGKKKTYDLDLLQANVSFLQAEYERLIEEVKDLRKLRAEDREALEGERVYALVLQQHIIERKPPPPPTRAEALGGGGGVS